MANFESRGPEQGKEAGNEPSLDDLISDFVREETIAAHLRDPFMMPWGHEVARSQFNNDADLMSTFRIENIMPPLPGRPHLTPGGKPGGGSGFEGSSGTRPPRLNSLE